MTQKKSKIPVNVLKKFDKVLYKPGNQVVIKWLGEIKQGYVKETKKTNDGVHYLVEAGSTYSDRLHRYPCGIQIGEHTTKYTAGLILYNETNQKYSGEHKDISTDTGRTDAAVGDDRTSSRGHDDSNRRKNANSGTNNRTTNDAKRGSSRNRNNTKTSRKDTTVNDAVKRQQDFLRGFVKK
jgi:hypothetical protein